MNSRVWRAIELLVFEGVEALRKLIKIPASN